MAIPISYNLRNVWQRPVSTLTTVPLAISFKLTPPGTKGGNVVYTGSDVRFLFPGGRYTLVVDGAGIDLSAVGTGKLTAVGKGSAEDGWVTVDGGTPQSIDLIDVAWYGRNVGNALGKVRNG